jgi:hypothetical protein
MYPAAQGNLWDVLQVTLLFGASTLATMTIVVAAAYLGIETIKIEGLGRYGHAAAGFAVLMCGVAVNFGL